VPGTEGASPAAEANVSTDPVPLERDEGGRRPGLRPLEAHEMAHAGSPPAQAAAASAPDLPVPAGAHAIRRPAGAKEAGAGLQAAGRGGPQAIPAAVAMVAERRGAASLQLGHAGEAESSGAEETGGSSAPVVRLSGWLGRDEESAEPACAGVAASPLGADGARESRGDGETGRGSPLWGAGHTGGGRAAPRGCGGLAGAGGGGAPVQPRGEGPRQPLTIEPEALRASPEARVEVGRHPAQKSPAAVAPRQAARGWRHGKENG